MWLYVIFGGIALGAKIFDLMVVAGAWGASPPASFVHLPYGKEFPIDPGTFFQPLSAVVLIGIIGALIGGWKSEDRVWLLIPFITFIAIWAITPAIFWPMINEFWGIHKGRLERSDADILSLVHRWKMWDLFRIGLTAVGFLSSLRALAGPLVPKGKTVLL